MALKLSHLTTTLMQLPQAAQQFAIPHLGNGNVAAGVAAAALHPSVSVSQRFAIGQQLQGLASQGNAQAAQALAAASNAASGADGTQDPNMQSAAQQVVQGAATATGGSPGSGAGAANMGLVASPGGPGNPGYRGWEQMASLNPVGSLRRKPWPVHILPATVTTDANGNGTMIWTPQEDFQAFLLTFPSAITSTGYVTQLTVGTRLVNIASGKMPIECFSEKNDARRMDFPFAKATQQIVAQISGGPASTALYGVLLGYGVGAPQQANVTKSARMGILPLGSTLIGPSASSTVTVAGQERFKARRVIFNSTASNFANVLISGIQIGTLIETAQVASFPAGIFSDLAVDDWVDFDTLPKNSNFSVTANNTNTSNSAVLEGFVIGDVWYDGEAA